MATSVQAPTTTKVEYWKLRAGQGTLDERCARIGGALRGLMKLEQPPCIWCGHSMILVNRPSRPPIWVHEYTREAQCFPGEGLDDEVGEVEPS